jgi:hypothetical protein
VIDDVATNTTLRWQQRSPTVPAPAHKWCRGAAKKTSGCDPTKTCAEGTRPSGGAQYLWAGAAVLWRSLSVVRAGELVPVRTGEVKRSITAKL